MLMSKQQVDDQDYDYDNRIRRHLANCEERLSQSDFKLVLKYHEQMILTSLAISTISKNHGTRDVFATFEGHLQKVLAWKENPDEFIQELVDQDTRDTLHGAIKEKFLNQL